MVFTSQSPPRGNETAKIQLTFLRRPWASWDDMGKFYLFMGVWQSLQIGRQTQSCDAEFTGSGQWPGQHGSEGKSGGRKKKTSKRNSNLTQLRPLRRSQSTAIRPHLKRSRTHQMRKQKRQRKWINISNCDTWPSLRRWPPPTHTHRMTGKLCKEFCRNIY